MSETLYFNIAWITSGPDTLQEFPKVKIALSLDNIHFNNPSLSKKKLYNKLKEDGGIRWHKYIEIQF